MAPYFMSLGEQVTMSQDTSANDLFSDDDEDDNLLDDLQSLPAIPIPDILPPETSLQQLLTQSCGTEDYHEVTSVQLKVIASQTSLQRLHIYLPQLIELDLTGSHLLSLRPLGYGLDNLCVLRVSRCALSSLDGLFGVCGLRELYASYNNVTELGLLPTLPQLKILDLRRNLVDSLMQVGYLALCEGLRELTLAECPVTELPGYKACIVTTLPKLVLLDGFLLAEGGQDYCREERQKTSDNSDGEDGATALPIKNIQENKSPDHMKYRRPATVCVTQQLNRSTHALPERPATASTKRQALPETAEPETLSEAVSKLTSGGVVCGNLAVALRGKHRQHKPAWATQVSDMEKPANRNGLTVSQLYSEIEQLEPDIKGAGDNNYQPLLVASQQWREAYHSFRKAHREQWNKEEEEENIS